MKGGRDMEARPRSEEQTRGSHQSTPLYLEISHHSARWERRSHWGFFVFFSAFFFMQTALYLEISHHPACHREVTAKEATGFFNFFLISIFYLYFYLNVDRPISWDLSPCNEMAAERLLRYWGIEVLRYWGIEVLRGRFFPYYFPLFGFLSLLLSFVWTCVVHTCECNQPFVRFRV